jgi:hypothetical protein
MPLVLSLGLHGSDKVWLLRRLLLIALPGNLARNLVRSSSGKSITRYNTSSRLPYPGIAERDRSRMAASASIGTQEWECQQGGTPESGEGERRERRRGLRSVANQEESTGKGSATRLARLRYRATVGKERRWPKASAQREACLAAAYRVAGSVVLD